MTPKEREDYRLGGVLAKAGKNLARKFRETSDDQQGITTQTPGRTAEDRGAVIGKDRTQAYKKTEQRVGGAKTAGSLLGVGALGVSANALLSDDEEEITPLYYELEDLPEEGSMKVTETKSGKETYSNSKFKKAALKAKKEGKDSFTFDGESFDVTASLAALKRVSKAKGGELGDDDYDYEEYRKRFIEETIQERKEQEEAEKERRAGNKRRAVETLEKKMTEGEKRAVAEETMRLNDEAAERYYEDKNRLGFNEGSLMMPVEGMPVDTYDNIPPEEMEEAMASQLPDDEMEDSYTSYVMDESLDDEEQEYLATVLESDPRLSDILDKVITVASEFSGAGEVDGPGTGVSDSIPARLSDGEFVMTKKATDQLGADNLQVMMDDAERAYDGGYQMKAMGGVMDEEDPEDPMMSKTQEEIEKLMMGANRMPSLQ